MTKKKKQSIDVKQTVEALWGDTPFMLWLKQAPSEILLQLVEEMDSYEESITDPDHLKVVELEHRTFRELIRMFAGEG